MNYESNSSSFIKGNVPWNKGKRINLDLDIIKKEHWNNGKSILDISRDLGVSDRLIRIRMNENNIPIRSNSIVTVNTARKLEKTQFKKGIRDKSFENKRLKSLKEKGAWNKNLKGSQVAWNKDIPQSQKQKDKHSTYMKNYYQSHPETIKLIKKARANQIFPLKDSSIEVKIQNYLKQLGIEYFTHQYINIGHAYQCDILIPSMNLVIECDGNYWHSYPIGRDIDHIRTAELIDNGFKVLRLWEFEINDMSLSQFQTKLNMVNQYAK